MVVDPDSTELECVGGTHRLEDVGCPDGGCEAVNDIVILLQHFFLGLEAADDDDGTEDFVLYDLGVVAVFCDDSWLEEEAFFKASNGGAFAAENDVRAVVQGTLDKS